MELMSNQDNIDKYKICHNYFKKWKGIKKNIILMLLILQVNNNLNLYCSWMHVNIYLELVELLDNLEGMLYA
jgi:hypothetical protein